MEINLKSFMPLVRILFSEGLWAKLIGGFIILSASGFKIGANEWLSMEQISEAHYLYTILIGAVLLFIPLDLVSRLLPPKERAGDTEGGYGRLWQVMLRDDLATVGAIVRYYLQTGEPCPRSWINETSDIPIEPSHRAVSGCNFRMLEYDDMSKAYTPTPEFLEYVEREQPVFDDSTTFQDAIPDG